MDSKGDSGECCVHFFVSDVLSTGEEVMAPVEVNTEMRHSSALCNQ